MSRILEQKFKVEVPELIASWFDGDKGKVILGKTINGQTADIIQKTNGYTFVVEWKKRRNNFTDCKHNQSAKAIICQSK